MEDIQYPTTLELLERQIKDWTETHRVCVIRMEKLIDEMKSVRLKMNGARQIVKDLYKLKEEHIAMLVDDSCPKR